MTKDQLLAEADGSAQITAGTIREPISAQLARQIACDAGIIPAVLAGPSQILDLGRTARTASPAQRRALILRDGGCSRPGCHTPPAWTQAHHITWWEHHGPTNLNNPALTCDHCHDLIHHHGWTITTDTNGKPHWHPPPQPPPPQPPEPPEPPDKPGPPSPDLASRSNG